MDKFYRDRVKICYLDYDSDGNRNPYSCNYGGFDSLPYVEYEIFKNKDLYLLKKQTEIPEKDDETNHLFDSLVLKKQNYDDVLLEEHREKEFCKNDDNLCGCKIRYTYKIVRVELIPKPPRSPKLIFTKIFSNLVLKSLLNDLYKPNSKAYLKCQERFYSNAEKYKINDESLIILVKYQYLFQKKRNCTDHEKCNAAVSILHKTQNIMYEFIKIAQKDLLSDHIANYNDTNIIKLNSCSCIIKCRKIIDTFKTLKKFPTLTLT